MLSAGIDGNGGDSGGRRVKIPLTYSPSIHFVLFLFFSFSPSLFFLISSYFIIYSFLFNFFLCLWYFKISKNLHEISIWSCFVEFWREYAKKCEV